VRCPRRDSVGTVAEEDSYPGQATIALLIDLQVEKSRRREWGGHHGHTTITVDGNEVPRKLDKEPRLRITLDTLL
jgi:hypothetical protein